MHFMFKMASWLVEDIGITYYMLPDRSAIPMQRILI